MRDVRVRHFWQDYDQDDVSDGDIDVAVNSEERTFSGPRGFRDCCEYLIGDFLHDGVFTDGYERPGWPETSDGGEAIYYHLKWPKCVTGRPTEDDNEFRSGSVHFDGPGVTPLFLSQIIRVCNVYDANAPRRSRDAGEVLL